MGHSVLGITSNPIALNNPQIRLTNYDTLDLARIIKIHSPRTIIHAAGSASVSESMKDPPKDYQSSVSLYTKLLDSIMLAGVKTRVLFISSAAVYGNVGNGPLSENMTCHPISPYGINKMRCEELGEIFSDKNDMENISLRIFSTFGELQKRLLIWDILQKYRLSQEVNLFGSGSETRDFIYIDQLVDQVLRIVNLPRVNERVVNLGSGYPKTVSDISNAIGNILNKKNSCKFNGQVREGDPLSLYPDLTKFQKLTDYRELDNFDNYLNKTIEAWR
jgi:UDP-glucose 4-epimerase